jgi:hypothetical protein
LKVPKFIAVLIVVSMMLLPAVPLSTHAVAPGSAQRLSVYVAGSDAAWFMTISSVNLTNRHFAAVESVAGVSWYNLTAIDTTSWSSDFQVFGPQGYNILPVPFVPLQGAFLSVGASSYSDASAAAAGFGSYLLTSFSSISNSSGTYTFFAPFEFDAIAPSTFISLVPFNSTGFTRALSATDFEKLPSHLVTIEGTRSSTGFSHGIVLGSIVTGALDPASRPALLSYFGSTIRFIQASNSSSSTITIHALDGIVFSSDNATVVSDSSAFTGSYSISLKPEQKIYRLNATVVQQPVQLLATRFIDVGVLTPGSNMSVTDSLMNLSNSTSVTAISYADWWWKSSGLFKLVSGTANYTGLTIAAGQSSTPTYVLQYVGNTTGPLQIPPTTVSYSYQVGNAFFHGYTSLNPITISLGVDEPVVYAYLTPDGKIGKSVGESQPLKIEVRNAGTRTASSVQVAGQSLGGLAPGASSSASVSVAASGLTEVNLTKSYDVSFTTPEGAAGSVTTNAFPIIFSHQSMRIALADLAVNSSVTQLPSGSGILNLTMDFSNTGRSAVTSFSAQSALPSGLGCGAAGGVNITCSSAGLAIHYSGVAANGKEHSWMVFNITAARNYVFWPFQTVVQTSGYNLTALSNAVGAPSGLVLTKQFSPSPLFTGMSSTVTVGASNSGPYSVYNATVTTVGDSFDQVSANSRTSQSSNNITAGSNFNFTYSVKASSPASNAPPAAVTAIFFLAGGRFAVTQQAPRISVFGVVSSSISSTPSTPEEGKPFTISVTLTNPAAVDVDNVQFLLPVPSGVGLSNATNATISGGGLSISLAHLAAGAKYVATVQATASSGETIPFTGKTGVKLSFTFAGTTLTGSTPSGGIAVGENVTSRYEIPIVLVVLVMLATAYYVRKVAGPTAPASQK